MARYVWAAAAALTPEGREALALAVRVEQFYIRGRALGIPQDRADADLAAAMHLARTSHRPLPYCLELAERKWMENPR